MKKENSYTCFDNFVVAKFTNCEEYFLCDKDDWEYLKKYSWCKDGAGYAMHRFYEGAIPKNIRMHTLIVKAEKPFVVDHINKDKRDNRRTNLRIVSEQKNATNKRLSTRNKTGVEGVCVDKKSGKYRAYIGINGKHKSLGWYNTLEEAKAARIIAENAERDE